MTEKEICQAAGYLIRQAAGKAFKTVQVPCSVKSVGENDGVEIRSGYVSPLGPTLHYVAHGSVSGHRLRMETIQVIGVDDKAMPFSQFP
ncbi:hypothetical protein [Thiorhodococcus fuscus]|uniref:Uncharacterized protein n=1 Tax=Thiorhodococcus fuscus TaxID=527200 RepID=A0ABW4Y7Z3_9GAMM